MVKAMRTPSSSSSRIGKESMQHELVLHVLTDVDGFNSNTLFNMGRLRRVRDLVRQYLRLAEGVDEGGSPST
jgi:hypothetical protein